VPGVVVVATAIDIVDVPDPGAAMDVGLKLTVTPAAAAGTLADNAIAELNEPVMVVVIVELPLKPRPTESDAGDAEMVKVEGTVTVKVTLVYCM